jgi:3-oxoacyl-[acyl-carrier-protein] synthase-3
MGSAILGVGHYLPEVIERLGVRRPIALDPLGPSKLASHAARSAFAESGLTAADVDFIVFATMTPDVTFPGAGVYFQNELGCDTIGALDIRAQCAGFIFSLAIADQFVRSGSHRCVLVAGGEVHSSGLDYSEKGSSVARLYGDGAGVVIVGSEDGSRGILATAIHSDGRHHREFWCEYPASKQHPVRITVDDIRAGRHFPTIDVDKVRDFAVAAMPSAISEALTQAAVPRDRVDRWILSCVVPEAAEAVVDRLALPSDRVDVPSAKYGHLTAAALPVALSEAMDAGQVGKGAVVALAACGAGFAWGAAVVAL